MIRIKPVPETEATGEISNIYSSIRTILELPSVPRIFLYMGAFPNYLSFIWTQTIKNLNDDSYVKVSEEISKFAIHAIGGVYAPSNDALLLSQSIANDPQKKPLINFTEKNIEISSKLYLLAVTIRESVKGRFFGIKQFSKKSESDADFMKDYTDGFTHPESARRNESGNFIQKRGQSMEKHGKEGIVRSFAEELFRITDREMERLAKREDYLTRRVELERFTVSKIDLLPHPMDSSLASVINSSRDNPLFPELIYLISEQFPTQSPYKLLASIVMNIILQIG